VNLWLVRHAQPRIGVGVCYGALDVAAEWAATQLAATELAQNLPHGLPVWVSPLQRCEQLAQCLRGLRPDLTFKTDARLVEMNFGHWEGVPWADVPRSAMDAWTDDFGDHRFGGLESANLVLQRVAVAWNEALCARSATCGDSVWITHAGVIRAATLVARGVFTVVDAAQWPRSAPGFGEWTVLTG
jgi:alpha-ribazole phosphatase